MARRAIYDGPANVVGLSIEWSYLYAHTFPFSCLLQTSAVPLDSLDSKPFINSLRAGSPSILFQHEVPLHDHSGRRRHSHRY